MINTQQHRSRRIKSSSSTDQGGPGAVAVQIGGHTAYIAPSKQGNAFSVDPYHYKEAWSTPL